MRKFRIAVLTAVAAMLLLGCGNKSGATSTFSPTQSSIFVKRDGTVSSALVEADQKGYYDQGELKAFIESEVAAYNENLGEDQVTLTSCTIDRGLAIAQFSYASGANLCDFAKIMEDTANQVDILEVTTVSDGFVSGKVSDGVWKDAKNGANVSLDTVINKGDLKLVTVDGAAILQLEGKIRYYSGEVTLVDKFTATTTGGKSYFVFK